MAIWQEINGHERKRPRDKLNLNRIKPLIFQGLFPLPKGKGKWKK